MKPRLKKLIWIAPLAILAMIVFICIGGQIVMRLWNWLLPSLFGWHEINFWQALALLALCRILFGGFGFRSSGRSNVLHRMDERWKQMTPEERERFRKGMSARTDVGPISGEGK